MFKFLNSYWGQFYFDLSVFEKRQKITTNSVSIKTVAHRQLLLNHQKHTVRSPTHHARLNRKSIFWSPSTFRIFFCPCTLSSIIPQWSCDIQLRWCRHTERDTNRTSPTCSCEHTKQSTHCYSLDGSTRTRA